MAECERHPGHVLPGCYYCRTRTEPPQRPFQEPEMDENSQEYRELLRAVRRAVARGAEPSAVLAAVRLITAGYERYGGAAHLIAREDFMSEEP